MRLLTCDFYLVLSSKFYSITYVIFYTFIWNVIDSLGSRRVRLSSNTGVYKSFGRVGSSASPSEEYASTVCALEAILAASVGLFRANQPISAASGRQNAISNILRGLIKRQGPITIRNLIYRTLQRFKRKTVKQESKIQTNKRCLLCKFYIKHDVKWLSTWLDNLDLDYYLRISRQILKWLSTRLYYPVKGPLSGLVLASQSEKYNLHTRTFSKIESNNCVEFYNPFEFCVVKCGFLLNEISFIMDFLLFKLKLNLYNHFISTKFTSWNV